MTHRPSRMLLKIPLVVFLCRIESGCFSNFSSNGFWVVTRSQFVFHFLSNCVLFIISVEDGRTVLRPHVGTLLVPLRRVVEGEELPDEVLIACLCGVVLHLHRFSMSRRFRTDLFVCRVLCIDRKSTRLNSSHSQISYA